MGLTHRRPSPLDIGQGGKPRAIQVEQIDFPLAGGLMERAQGLARSVKAGKIVAVRAAKASGSRFF